MDRSELVKALEGVGVPTTSWLPPGIPGHNPELGKEFQGYDPRGARRLLAEAGFPDGREYPILSLPVQVGSAATATFLARELKTKLGIEAAPQPLETPTFNRQLANRDSQAILVTTSVTVPEPQTLFRIGNRAAPRTTAGTATPSTTESWQRRWNWPMPPSGRRPGWRRIRSCWKDSPAIFLFHEEQLWLRQAYVQGLSPAFRGATPARGEYARIWLDKK